MSCVIEIKQRKYAAGMADTEGWQFEICWTTQESRMRIKNGQENLFFIMWLLYVQLLVGQNRYTGLCESLWSIRYDQWTAS